MGILEELLKRDEQRVKDGFSKKIKVMKVIKRKSGKIKLVPTVEEEKLVHGNFEPKVDDGAGTGGQGEGEEGEVIGEDPLHGEGEGDIPRAGDEGGGERGMETEAYELGKEIAEELKLPNLKKTAKKVRTDEYVYDLTSRNVGSGQVLDKKETQKRIIKTNSLLGLLNKDKIDTSKCIVAPRDKVYRVFSREKVEESMAVMFLMRDYSGSMFKNITEPVLQQQAMIYAWLMYEFGKRVILRFVLHDTEAKEVFSAHEYFNARAAGGTRVASAFRLVNDIVLEEGLARDYNIYVLHGTDGDDWDTDGKETLPELEQMFTYVNRIGISVVRHQQYGISGTTGVEKYINSSGFLTSEKDKFRMYVMNSSEVSDIKNKEAIKFLFSE